MMHCCRKSYNSVKYGQIMGNLELYIHDDDSGETDGNLTPEPMPEFSADYWAGIVRRNHCVGKVEGVVNVSRQHVLYYHHVNTDDDPIVTVVAGYIKSYKCKMDGWKEPVSEVELIEDSSEQEKIKKLFPNQNVEFW